MIPILSGTQRAHDLHNRFTKNTSVAYDTARCKEEFKKVLQSFPAPAQTLKVLKCLLFELLMFISIIILAPND